MKTISKLGGILFLVVVLVFGYQTMTKQNDDNRRVVLLSVVQKDVVHERGKPRVNISYRSSSTEWRQIEYRGLDPWNRNVSVKKGDTVYLEAWQQSANQIDCLITIPSMPGHVSNDTRKSIGTVKCRLTVPQ